MVDLAKTKKQDQDMEEIERWIVWWGIIELKKHCFSNALSSTNKR